MTFVDTGLLVAVIHTNHAYRQSGSSWFEHCIDTIVVPGPVVVEARWLICRDNRPWGSADE